MSGESRPKVAGNAGVWRSPFRIWLGILLLTGLAVASCRAAAPTQPTAEAPVPEKTLIIAAPELPSGLDYCALQLATGGEVMANVYSYWTIPEVVELEDGRLVDSTFAGEGGMGPAVFESWERSEDGTVWTFHLRQDVVDSFDNQVKAEDVKWQFERTMSLPQCSYVTSAMQITNVEQIEVIDDYTLQVTLPGPSPIILRTLHVQNHQALGAATAQQHSTSDDPWAQNWIKTNAAAIGPYMIEKWTPGEEMVLVRNPNYYGDPPEIGRVIYRLVPEAANRMALLIKGEVHMARDLTQEQLDALDETEGVHSTCGEPVVFDYVALNTQEGPTADVRVRRALAYAVPYQDILDSVYRGRATHFWSFVTGATEHAVPQSANPYVYDLEKAKALLAEADYADGFDLELLIADRWPSHERIAVLLNDSFAKIGVNLKINQQPYAVWADRGFSHDIEAIMGEDTSIVHDVAYYADLWLYDGPPPNDNFAGYAQAEFNQLQSETLSMLAGPEREAKLTRMQEIFIEDSPWLMLANLRICYGFRDNVTGFAWHTGDFIRFEDLHISE